MWLSKVQMMIEIPEYHSLRASDDTPGAVTVSVRIDGTAHTVSIRQMSPHVVARLVEAFLSGALDFMSFDEHPKWLTGMSLKRKDGGLHVTLTARSLAEKDGFPQEWEIAEPRIYGADPWDGQMR